MHLDWGQARHDDVYELPCHVVAVLTVLPKAVYNTRLSIMLMNVFINRGRGLSLLKVIVRMFLNLLNGNRSVLQV